MALEVAALHAAIVRCSGSRSRRSSAARGSGQCPGALLGLPRVISEHYVGGSIRPSPDLQGPVDTRTRHRASFPSASCGRQSPLKKALCFGRERLRLCAQPSSRSSPFFKVLGNNGYGPRPRTPTDEPWRAQRGVVCSTPSCVDATAVLVSLFEVSTTSQDISYERSRTPSVRSRQCCRSSRSRTSRPPGLVAI